MQLCPLFNMRPCAAPETAKSTSASASTINGSLPPSSNTVFFKHSPATLATADPAPSEPVKVTAAISGLRMTFSTWPEVMSSVLNKFSGKPALINISSTAKAEPATFEACFSAMLFPAIKAGAAPRNTCHNGKFQGITAKIIPKGSNRT